ncbi:helix-turn-helix domain-containing protein [Alloiococcus sp. CFN-8]|uniref:helix-turn-helix domain-containing protein n=1 Tax=Alloiococcus sp. CFN-8 TaxID=3416081 RepID=UPI003CED8D46
MFSDNLKMIRKSKGFTQEELAAKVNVVRQTVSKWEKGLSVPDAVTLQKIAEVLDVSVNELLGADLMEDSNRNEIAEQLARVNEQLAIRNRRWGKFWKIIVIIILFIAIINLIIVLSFGALRVNLDKEIHREEVIIYDKDIE